MGIYGCAIPSVSLKSFRNTIEIKNCLILEDDVSIPYTTKIPTSKFIWIQKGYRRNGCV